MKVKSFSFWMMLSMIPACIGTVMIASFSSQNVDRKVIQAENEQVTFDSIAWNNIDYSSPIIMPSPETHYVPQYGYCILLKYSKYFNPTSTDNFAYTHPEYSSHILVNGTSINEIEGCLVKIQSGHLFIYFPASAVSYVDDYFRPTLEVEEGASFYGSILPYGRFEYKDSIGKNGKWENTTSFVRSNVTYNRIEWNNTYYGTAETYPYTYGKNALLIRYSDVLSMTSAENSSAFVQERNLKNTILGSAVKLNGTYFKDIDDAEIRYFNQQLLWLYTPNMTRALSNERFAKIEIEATSVFDKNIPAKSFFFKGNQWVDNLTIATFSKIAWNNIDYSGTAPNLVNGKPTDGYLFALQYSEYIGEGNLNVNMANNSYDIGSHLLINGVPCKDVSGAIVGSYSNMTLLFVYFPDASISYNDSYDRPTVEIETDCLYNNYILPSIRLEYCASIGILNGWNIEPQEVDNPFSVISWNNIGYGDGYEGKKGLLLSYTNNLSNYQAEYNGQVSNKNLVNTNLGKNIKINGVSLNNFDNAELKYFSVNHLWIYAPNMTVPSNGYSRPQLSLDIATKFFDSIIPTIQLVFKENSWRVSDEDVHIRTSFTGFYQEHNNLDLGNTYRDTILCFANSFYDSSKNNTDLKAANEEFVNKATLNGIPLKNVPGIYVIYMGNNYIHLMIREVDLAPTQGYPAAELNIPRDTHLYNYFINEVTFYLNNSSMQWMTAQNGVIINTLEEATFVTTGINNQITGMRFESRINKSMFDVQVSKYGLQNISFGTYIVPKINYINSNAPTPIDYVNYNSPSSSTYLDIPNAGKDFTNPLTASSDGYYRYTGTVYNVKSSHYADGFIGIGYLKAGDRTYYGNVSDNSTTYYELLVQAYDQGLINNSYFTSILSFNTTANAYELNDVSLVSSGYTFSYANKGYYALSVNKDIRTIVIDGIPYKVNLKSGSSTYFAFYNNTIDFRNSLEMSKGIGEPIYELFPDNTNSNTDLNTVDNVSSLNQAFGSDAERIWLDLKGGLGIDSYGFNQCDDNGEFRFDASKVARLHNYLAKFTSKGMRELTLLVSGWANDKDAPVFLKNGNWLTATQAYQTTGAVFHNIIPSQTAESYQKWLDANEGLAYKIAKEFPEFKYIEAINEIDGGGYQYSPTYITSGEVTKPTIDTVAKWSMDLCHAYSKGIRKAGSSLRVMSPSFSCLDSNGSNHPYNTKDFINRCYNYIENSTDTYTNNWFQVMNLHPYVFPSKSIVGEDSVYLWNTYPVSSNNYEINNTDYDADWINYMNYVHNTIMSGHGDSKKSVAITEFGFSDMGGTTDTHWKYVNKNNRFNTIATNMMNRINSLNYLETLIWFRLFDFPIGDPSIAFGGCLEQNFGLVETDKTLKELGKVLYQLWNGGSVDYSNILDYLSTMEGRN